MPKTKRVSAREYRAKAVRNLQRALTEVRKLEASQRKGHAGAVWYGLPSLRPMIEKALTNLRKASAVNARSRRTNK
jgi:hypothetical protein